MHALALYLSKTSRKSIALLLSVVTAVLMLHPQPAHALPTFARQTGQNCVACHTGGQYPELTPYGRLFKMTGYTIGERTLPFSVMGVASVASVADTNKSDVARSGTPSTDAGSDFYKNNEPILGTGSLFIAGKVTDNVGAFLQITHDPYNSSGHTQADNMDLRYADRLVDTQSDLIWGVSLNNDPSVSDPWNTAPAWMQYVPVASPSSHQFLDGATSYPGLAAGANIAGVSAYVYWNQTLYGEIGFYATADGAFRVFREGIDDSAITRLRGNNPYWRFAYTRAWGPNNIMVGTTGMLATILDNGSDGNDGNAYSQNRNLGLDAQYQYILDPHTITAQVAYMQQTVNYSGNTMAGTPTLFQADGVTPINAFNSSDTINTFRAKLAYTYRATYGGSVSYFSTMGTANTLNQTAGYSAAPSPVITYAPNVANVNASFTGLPDTSGATLEVFYIPIQNLRLGVQYTAYEKYNGSATNYDGNGRNASDNNTLYMYAWFAF